MSSEITFCKNKIKELYRKNYAYTLDQIKRFQEIESDKSDKESTGSVSFTHRLWIGLQMLWELQK